MIEQEHRGYLIKVSPVNPKSWVIQNMKRGGSLPMVFDGLFTDRHTAMRIIDSYIDKNGAVNAKAKSTGGT